MKKYYVPAALGVLLLGILSVWIIIDRLPVWMGTTRNQHQFIDQLEQKGVIDFEAATIEGQKIKMSDLKGKIIILSFWASWCGPCVEEFPSMLSLLQQFPNDVVMLAVSADFTREDIDVFFKSLKLDKKLPNLYVVWDPDHKYSTPYEIQKMPETFIFKRDQKLLRKVIGSIKWDAPDAIEFFKSHLTE